MNATNQSTIPPEPPTWNWAQHAITLTVGIIITFANTFTACIVIASNRLRYRREVIILLGVIISDVVMGLAHVCISTRAVILARWPHLNYLVPAIMAYFFSASFSFALQVMTLMLLVVSVDRLLAVCAPIVYHTLTRRYALFAIASPFVFAIVSLCVGAILSVTTKDIMLPLTAVSSQTFPLGFNVFNTVVQFFGSVSSVLVYAGVVASMMFQAKYKTDPGRTTLGLSKAARQRQANVTRFVGTLSAVTLIFFIIPSVVIFHLSFVDPNMTLTSVNLTRHMAFAMRFTQELYSLITITMFYARPTEVRSEVLLWLAMSRKNMIVSRSKVKQLQQHNVNAEVPLGGVDGGEKNGGTT